MKVDEELETGLVEVRGSSVGSGFLVSEDLIVTCAHVVGSTKAKPEVAFLGAAIPSPATVVPDLWRSEEEGDIAVLKLQGGPPQGHRPLRLGRTSGTEGHVCSTLGFPDVSAVQVVRGQGIIRALVFDRWGNRKLQLSSKEITGGFSGAPLLDLQTKRVVGMVVWSAEKIPEVAWAVPAEALHSLLSAQIQGLRLEPPKAVEDYLHRVEEHCDRDVYHIVDVRGSLQSLYVPLMVRQFPSPEEERRTTPHPLAKTAPEKVEQILPAARVLARGDPPHAIIVAAPGSGKSTLLRYFARYAWTDPGVIGLTAPHIPLPAVLGSLVIERPIKVALAEALASELSLTEPVPDGWWDGWSSQAQANWLILLDALDEVRSENHRAVLDRLNTLGREIIGHRIVVTARHTGYTYGELDPKLFRHYELRPFDREGSREFARRWFGEMTDGFLGELDGLDAGDLKDTPLLLTLAAKMYEDKQVLAKQRSALYADLVERALERAISSGLNSELESELGKEFKGGAGLHLDNLAYLAQRMTESEQASARASVKALMAERLMAARIGWGKAPAEDCAARWANIMGRRSGLLVGNRGVYTFPHPTVREYLTAKWLLDTEGLQGMVARHWSEVRYEEVLAFALSIHVSESGAGQHAEECLAGLASSEVAPAGQDLARLFSTGRSPLRTAMHLSRAAGLDLVEASPFLEAVRAQLATSELRQCAVAQDSRIPGEILTWLAGIENESVRWELARNPSSPPDALKRLVDTGDPDIQWRIADDKRTPPEVLEYLAEVDNVYIQLGVATHPSVSPDVLGRLVELCAPRPRYSMPFEVMDRLEESGIDVLDEIRQDEEREMEENLRSRPSDLASMGDVPGGVYITKREVLRAVAEHPKTPPEVLERLVEIGGYDDEMARRACTPLAILERLLKKGDNNTLWSIAKNSEAPPEILAKLANLGCDTVQRGLASNPSTQPEILKQLVEVGSAEVRGDVAENPSTPREVLEQLANIGGDSVQCGLASNPRTPPEILKLLASAAMEKVQWRLAQNPNSPTDVLLRLAEIGCEGLQTVIIRRGSAMPTQVLMRLAQNGKDGVRVTLAAHPDAPPEILVLLSELGSERVQARVAWHRSTPTDVLRRLADSPSQEVRRAVAGNPGTPPDVLEHLAESGGEPERLALAVNASTPPGLLSRLAETGTEALLCLVAKHPSTPIATLKCLSETCNEHVQISVAENRGSPPELLQHLADCGGSSVRSALAKNQSTPPGLLRSLAEDSNESVQRAIARRLDSPQEVLCHLVITGCTEVKRLVASNPNVLLEIL